MRLELVKDWMSRDVITAVPTLELLEADALMRKHNIRRLPVVENGRLVGIVTHGDIREARPSAATSLSTWELNYLLANLIEPRLISQTPTAISAIPNNIPTVICSPSRNTPPIVETTGIT